ncbi:GFA family protein [Pelagerythrobacter sp.]|uniref:GFA family protein n=1 Tax=Pelagerythrobacter sp. TaxID=2800702 RepID=UPI0035B20DB3
MSYTASCHCGAIGATVAGDLPGKAMSCNCSICKRKGTVLHFVPAAEADIAAPAGKLSDYQFNKRAIHHQFCTDCGCSPFSVGTGPDGSEMVAVNLRCVPECDLDALEIAQYDGASL